MRFLRLAIFVVVIVAAFLGVMSVLKTRVPVVPAPTAFETLRVEGISYDPVNAMESVAVINGVFLNPGNQYEHYRVLEILPTTVRVLDIDTNKQHSLPITGGRPRLMRETQMEERLSGPSQGAGIASPQQFLGALAGQESGASSDPPVSSVSNFNPLAMLGKATELSTVADLKNVHVSAMAYYYESGGYGDELSMEALEKSGMVSGAFNGGVKGKYRYSVHVVGDGVEASAQPVSPSATARYYLIDGDGVMRSNVGSVATAQSAEYNF
jgi:hypothetical protein